MGGKDAKLFHFFVISKGRPKNVKRLNALFPRHSLPTWIVGTGEAEPYKNAGAFDVVEGGGLCASRNKAIDIAKTKGDGSVCVELSDDICWVHIIHREKWMKPESQSQANELARTCAVAVSPITAARYVDATMRLQGSHLGGVYLTVNKGFALMCPPVSTDLFVIGDFLVIDPFSSPRFDETMTLKEDYDFTAQHLDTYGVAIRSNRVFVKALHYKNSGGAVAVRSNKSEQRNINILRTKWPGVFRDHPTRGVNEVRMYWKGRGKHYAPAVAYISDLERREMFDVLWTIVRERTTPIPPPFTTEQFVALLEACLSRDPKTYRNVHSLRRRICDAEKLLKKYVLRARSRLEVPPSPSNSTSTTTSSITGGHVLRDTSPSRQQSGGIKTVEPIVAPTCRPALSSGTIVAKLNMPAQSISSAPKATPSVALPPPLPSSTRVERKKRRRQKTPRRIMLSSAFVMSLVEVDAKLAFNLSYQKGGRSFERFEKYKVATSARDALRLGASKADLKWDLSKGIGKLVDVKQQKDLEACLERKLQDVVAEGGGKVSIATNGEFRSGLADFQQGIEGTASNDFMRKHYETLLKRIFGERGTNKSWLLMADDPRKPLWKEIVNLLQGSLFSMLIELRLGAKYGFPLADLPRHLIELIGCNQQHPIRDFFSLLQDSQYTDSHIYLEPLEFFLFNFAHFAVSTWRQGDRDRSYVNDLRQRSRRELVANLAGTVIESRGSSLDAVTIPQLSNSNVYIDLLVRFLRLLWPYAGLMSRDDDSNGALLYRRLNRYRVVFTSLVIEFWLEQNELLKLAPPDRLYHQHMQGGGAAIMVSSPSYHRRHSPYVNPTRCQVESILTFMTYILADPSMGQVMMRLRQGLSNRRSVSSPFEALPRALQDVQLPLYEFFAGAFSCLKITTSTGLADREHLFGSIVDVWYSCVLQPWNARRRLLAKKLLVQSEESSAQTRKGSAWVQNVVGGQNRGAGGSGNYTDDWKPYIAYNYIFFAPLFVKFIRRAASEFNFKSRDAAHFDLLWEVLRFFVPDHTRPGPLWSAVRQSSRVLYPILAQIRNKRIGSDQRRSASMNEDLRNAVKDSCQLAYQSGIAQDTMAFENDDESVQEVERMARFEPEALREKWYMECTWPSRISDETGDPKPKSLRAIVLEMCEKLFEYEDIICKVYIPGRRDNERSATLFFAKAAASVIKMGTGVSGDDVRRRQFEHTLCRLGEIFNLTKEIQEAREHMRKKKAASAAKSKAATGKGGAVRVAEAGYDRFLPAFLTPKSRESISKGVSRIRRRQLRFVGDDMMRPITWWECPRCPCVVKSLVRLSLFLNAKLDAMSETSSGISSEYYSTRRLREVMDYIEALPRTLSAKERDEVISQVLRSAMIRGEAKVVQYLEEYEGAKLAHRHIDNRRHRQYRINLRYLADIRNWKNRPCEFDH
eukprot:g762.t1